MRCLLAVAVLAALVRPAVADELPEPSDIMLVPAECMELWSIPGGTGSPAVWDAAISFASCIQDRSIYVIDRADQLPEFVDNLQAALGPALQFYVAALAEAPDRVKLRAAYYIGAGQVALITRARLSLTTTTLRPALEPLLEPSARLAYSIFTGIERVAAADSTLMQDVVVRHMVRSAHELARQLQRSWSIPVDDTPPRVLPR
jgi:hypothetical protein